MIRWYHPEFENDLISAARYYEEQSVGLGRDYIGAAESTVELIMTAPSRWPERQGGIRRLQLNGFPYLIRYRINADAVELLSILHGARHPDTDSGRA